MFFVWIKIINVYSQRTLEEKLKTTATEREVSNIKNEGASMYKLLKNGLTSGDKDILNVNIFL